MRIFLAEDEQDLNAIIVQKLTEDGYSVDHCFDGRTAIDILSCTEYDAVILDIMMPKMNGYEFVEQFRMMDKNTQVLLLTAKKEWQDKKMGFAIGIDDYMTKPVNYEELQWRIRALLRRAKISNEKQIIIGDVVISEDFNMVVRG